MSNIASACFFDSLNSALDKMKKITIFNKIQVRAAIMTGCSFNVSWYTEQEGEDQNIYICYIYQYGFQHNINWCQRKFNYQQWSHKFELNSNMLHVYMILGWEL